MAPSGILVKKFNALWIAFHFINQAFQQCMFILFGIQFSIFIGKMRTEVFEFGLGLKNLSFYFLMLLLQCF